MEGIVFIAMNGTWKTPIHGLVVSEWWRWMEFRVERKEGSRGMGGGWGEIDLPD